MGGNRFKIKEGDKFGFVTVLEELPVRINVSGKHERMVRVRCECGEIRDMYMWNVIKRKAYISCGCKRERGKNFYKHGLSNHPLHVVWRGMISRCYYKKSKFYLDYGGRGIIVCNEWKSDFISFYNWAINNGYRKGLEIDRYPNNNGNYEPSNCRWATEIQNCNNRRNSVLFDFYGEKLSLPQIARKENVQYTKLYCRVVKTKMSIYEAIDAIIKNKKLSNNGTREWIG